MRTIGSRELKEHLGEVLRDVRESGEEYAVTRRGKTVARIVPEPVEAPPEPQQSFDEWWAELDEIAAQIGQLWPKDVSAAQAISEDRREL